jgi:hypothetical protein
MQAYVEACWPLIESNPHAEYWAERFTEAQRQLAASGLGGAAPRPR